MFFLNSQVSRDYNEPQPPNLPPWSQISHVQRHTGKHSFEHTCACKNCSCKTKGSFYKNSPARRLNRSKIVPEPSANKTGTSVTRSWCIVAIMMQMQLTSIYKHNNVCISSLKGDKLTREGIKSTWNYVFVLSGYSTRKTLDETWFYPLGIDCTGKYDQNDGYVQISVLVDPKVKVSEVEQVW